MLWCELSFLWYRIHNVLRNTAYSLIDTGFIFDSPPLPLQLFLKRVTSEADTKLFGITWSKCASSSPCHVLVCPGVSSRSCRNLIVACIISWKVLPCANSRTLPSSSVDYESVENDKDSPYCWDFVKVLVMMKLDYWKDVAHSWSFDEQTIESIHWTWLS